MQPEIQIPKDDVRNQSHYTQYVIQPIEFIANNNMNFLVGNIVKYVSRYKGKDGVKDLEKARVYLDWLIEIEKTGEVKI